MTDINTFTTEEWTLLKRAPFLVFYFVASADSRIESDEVEKLIKQLESPERYGSEVFSQVIVDIMGNARELAVTVGGIISKQGSDLQSQFVAVQQTIDAKLDSDDAQAFKAALVALGMDIAAATGDAELPVSKEEWNELQRFKDLLKYRK